jgi:NSS family neurotransmitter:Na+ symporter
MISGLFVAAAIVKYGILQIREKDLNVVESDWRLGRWWDIVLKFFVQPAAVILLIWWLWKSATEYAPDQWFNPFNQYSIMTCLVQWFIMLAIFILFNRKIGEKIL